MYLTGACRSSSRGKFKLSDTRKIILAKYRPRPLRGLRSTNTRVSHRYDVSPTVAKVSHTHTRTLAMRQQRERASTSLPWPSVGAEAEEWGSRSGVPEQLQQLAIEQYNLFGPRSLPLDAQIPRSPTAANIYIPTSRP